MKRAVLLAGLAIGLLAARGAHAQSKKECADAYLAGQVARSDGHLRDARVQFERCAAASCPAALVKDCKPWLEQADRDIPKLAVTVTDDAGTPVPSARVTVDGTALPASGELPVDPGEHVVRAEASGLTPREQRVKVAAADGRRAVSLRLARDVTAPVPGPVAERASRPVPVGPIVVAASGLVAIGVFAGLGAAGSAKKANLDTLGCKPNCSSSDVSAGRSLYLGADIALGVGLAAVVAGAVWLGVKLGAPAPAAEAVTFSPSRGAGMMTFHF